MHVVKLEMLTNDCDVICITTNGFTKTNGEAVMGRGIAKQMADLVPELPNLLGQLLVNYGNKVHMIGKFKPRLVSFPVKPEYVINDGTNVVSHCKTQIGEKTAGFLAKADLTIIEQSCKQLVELANQHPEWNTILVPKAGCGAGELDWKDVEPIMRKYLDNRFIICYK